MCVYIYMCNMQDDNVTYLARLLPVCLKLGQDVTVQSY